MRAKNGVFVFKNSRNATSFTRGKTNFLYNFFFLIRALRLLVCFCIFRSSTISSGPFYFSNTLRPLLLRTFFFRIVRVRPPLEVFVAARSLAVQSAARIRTREIFFFLDDVIFPNPVVCFSCN